MSASDDRVASTLAEIRERLTARRKIAPGFGADPADASLSPRCHRGSTGKAPDG